MKIPRLGLDLRGLRTQVLLWTVLPLTILLIVFSLSGISSHQQSMQALAADENARLVTVLARLIAERIETTALRLQQPSAEIPVEALNLDPLLSTSQTNADSVLVLLGSAGNVIFSQGELPEAIEQWPGVAEALAGHSGVRLATDTAHSDVIAYTPVPDTHWALVIREPWHSLTDPLLRFEEVMPFILFTAVVVSLLTLFFGLRYVVRPLQALSVRANEIGQGKFDTSQHYPGGVKEITDLHLTLNEMARRIQSDQAALQEYLRAVTQAQEEERERIARELHDETVQTLIALGHRAQMAQRTLTRDPEQTPARIGELREMIAQAIEEVRRFTQALHPHYLAELGLVAGLETLTREAEAGLKVTGSPYRLKAEKELAIYRIAQEALNNARRHAQAQHIQVEISFEEKQVVLSVRDDGRGFAVPTDLSSLTHRGHFGLIGMRERSQLVGGQLQVEAQPDSGTTIRFTVLA
jgi:signal transduction histidine kinase